MVPPSLPKKAAVKQPLRLARPKAKYTFLLLPEVEMPITTSPGWAKPSI